MRVGEPERRSLRAVLGLGRALLLRAQEEQAPALAASVIEQGEAVVLGALQRRGRVLERAAVEAAGAIVLRRSTTGTAVYLRGRALLFTLALPSLSTLAADASPRTLLNRNLRGFLHGLRRSGALAHYFGREWLSVDKRPAAVAGFELLADGTTLIELFAGLDAPLALPPGLVTEDERAVDRWLGKEPATLGDKLRRGDPLALAAQIGEAVAANAGLAIEPLSLPTEASLADASLADASLVEERSDDEPAPRGALFAPPLRVPIGWLDAALVPSTGELWLGGDLLCASHALRAIGEAVARGEASAPFPEGQFPLEGCTLADLVAAAQSAARLGVAR
jgi:hypothetical protein